MTRAASLSYTFSVSSADIDACRTAIEAVLGARARRRSTDTNAAGLRRIGHGIERLVDARLERQRASIRASTLEPIDPLELPWDAFQRFGAARAEVRWTQWLASLLRPDSDDFLAPVMMQALVDLLAPQTERVQAPEGTVGLDASDWEALARRPSGLRVRAEVGIDTTVNGRAHRARPDIVVATDDVLVVIELKLWGTLNKGVVEQPRLYEAAARTLADASSPPRRVGLVTLTVEHPEEVLCCWHRVTWDALGLALRRRLGEQPCQADANAELHRRIPALVLIQAIERHVIGLPTIEDLERLDARELVRIADRLSGLSSAFGERKT